MEQQTELIVDTTVIVTIITSVIVAIITFASGIISVFKYIKTREQDTVEKLVKHQKESEEQNKEIALLKQKVKDLEVSAKEIRSEIFIKVDRLDNKIDDLKHMLMEFLAKQK